MTDHDLTRLRHHEKEQLRDADTWDELDTAVESIVTFRGREAARLALLDAADDLERDPRYHDATGIITGWLRDRADRVDAEDTHTQPEAETEDRWCPTCQKYRPTIDDECTECGTDT